jgi:hypothetical protein
VKKTIDRSTFLFASLVLVICAGSTFGQSTNQNFPTPVSTNEISGSIKARDVGDARLTSYFYQFDGDQGDVFINVVARNFTGDIDVFTLNGLRPITKIVLFADATESETGRVVYLRKPEKMILRVQGRTPGDDPATFRIKFAGSFVASTMGEPAAEPALPSLSAKNESGIRVNSVGTIVEIIPKATPTPALVETASSADQRENTEDPAKNQSVSTDEKRNDDRSTDAAESPDKKVEVVVTNDMPEKPAAKATPARRRSRARGTTKPEPSTDASATAASTDKPPKTTTTRARRGRAAAAKTPPEKVPDPLENVNLIIQFKDGTAIQRPMSQVLRFSVDRGVLTVISRDGSIGRYSILDVAKVTIE